MDEAEFARAAGVGVQVSVDEVEGAVRDTLAEHADSLLRERYAYNLGALLAAVKARGNLKWADGKLLKATFDAQLLSLLGPRNASATTPPKQTPTKEQVHTLLYTTLHYTTLLAFVFFNDNSFCSFSKSIR